MNESNRCNTRIVGGWGGAPPPPPITPPIIIKLFCMFSLCGAPCPYCQVGIIHEISCFSGFIEIIWVSGEENILVHSNLQICPKIQKIFLSIISLLYHLFRFLLIKLSISHFLQNLSKTSNFNVIFNFSKLWLTSCLLLFFN